MAAFAPTYDWGYKFLDALGIPQNMPVKRVAIVIDCDDAIKVYLTTLLREECAEKVTDVLRTVTVRDVQIESDNSIVVTDHEGKVSYV